MGIAQNSLPCKSNKRLTKKINNCLFLLVGSIIFSMKRNFFLVDRNNSCIRDSNAIGIASKIFNGISITIDSFFDLGIPVCGIKFVSPGMKDLNNARCCSEILFCFHIILEVSRRSIYITIYNKL